MKDLGLEPEAVHALLKAHPSLLLEGPAAAFSALCAALELDAALVLVRGLHGSCFYQRTAGKGDSHELELQMLHPADARSNQIAPVCMAGRRWHAATRASWRCRRSMQHVCCAA